MDAETKQTFNQYMKLKMRLKRHGDINTVKKTGRKKIERTDEERKELQRKYYREVVAPRLKARREADKVNCDCGITITKNSLEKHKQTNSHIKRLSRK